MSDLGYIQSSPKKEYTGIKTIRSLTIKQLLSSEQQEGSSIIYINNIELNTFKTIGWVSNVKATSSGKSFLLEDSTGIIDCMMWCNKTYEEYLLTLIEDGSFIKINGILKEFGNKKSIQVTFLYVIEDYNELTYHFSNVLQEYLFYTKKEITNKNDMNKIHKDLIECVRNYSDENSGVSVDLIIKCLKNIYDEKMVREGMDFLVDNCYLILENECYKVV